MTGDFHLCIQMSDRGPDLRPKRRLIVGLVVCLLLMVVFGVLVIPSVILGWPFPSQFVAIVGAGFSGFFALYFANLLFHKMY